VGAAGEGVFRVKLRRPICLAIFVLAVLLAALLLPIARAAISRNIRTKNFTFPQYYEQTISADNPTNRLKTLLRGAIGQFISNDVYGITTARLEHYPASGLGTNLVALTPYCLLDRENRTVTSTARVDIAASDGVINVHGDTGFYYHMTNQVLIVSNRSRTVIRRGLFEKATP
jgi:hypothetical protein